MSDRAVLSVDVELFSQTPAYRGAVGTTDDQGVGLSGVGSLEELCDEYDVNTTCFVVSEVAERYPDAIRRLSDAGHEIASHTHTHRLLTTLDADARRTEMERSRTVLERVTGRTVSGFRAPAFDFGPDHFDALDTAGYTYDSSVVASRWIPGWYGGEYDLHAPAPASRVRPDAPAGLAELPVSVLPGLRLPLTGTWLRFFGPRYTILGMKLLARRGIAPVLYVHPWEFVDLPAVEGVPRRVYWHTGAWMRRAVERILAQPLTFTTARSVINETVSGGESAASGIDTATANDESGVTDDATAGDG